MIIASEKNTVARCITRAENKYNFENIPFILMDCIHALEQSDAREVMVLSGFFIKQFNDDYCLAPFNEEVGTSQTITQGTDKGASIFHDIIVSKPCA